MRINNEYDSFGCEYFGWFSIRFCELSKCNKKNK